MRLVPTPEQLADRSESQLPSRSFVRGFTLIEILVVIGISVVILGFSLGVGFDFYDSQALIAERDSLVSLLRTARTKAMNNTNQSSHGVFIDSGQYVVFQGNSYAERSQDFDWYFPRSEGAVISGPSEVVFGALEGNSNVSGTISISSGPESVDIFLNYGGRIHW